MLSKEDIRAEVKKHINEISHEDKQKESSVVCEKLITFLTKQSFETLIVYDPLSDEIDISEVTNWAKKAEKEIVTIEKK